MFLVMAIVSAAYPNGEHVEIIMAMLNVLNLVFFIVFAFWVDNKMTWITQDFENRQNQVAKDVETYMAQCEHANIPSDSQKQPPLPGTEDAEHQSRVTSTRSNLDRECIHHANSEEHGLQRVTTAPTVSFDEDDEQEHCSSDFQIRMTRTVSDLQEEDAPKKASASCKEPRLLIVGQTSSSTDWIERYVTVTQAFMFLSCYLLVRFLCAKRIWKGHKEVDMFLDMVHVVVWIVNLFCITRTMPWAAILLAIPPFMDEKDQEVLKECLEHRPDGIDSKIGYILIMRRGMHNLDAERPLYNFVMEEGKKYEHQRQSYSTLQTTSSGLDRQGSADSSNGEHNCTANVHTPGSETKMVE
jgi:hypothetical protein